MVQDYYNQIVKISKGIHNSAQIDSEKEQLLKDYPHIFVLGCVMDSQIKYERAWKIPLIIAKELSGKGFDLFLNKSEQWYINFFEQKKLHRFNESMAKAFYAALQRIHEKYNDNAALIWNDKPTSAELVCRFLEFDRVGIKIATMAANILSRDYKVPLKDYYAIEISPDIHVKRAMYRLGLLSQQKVAKFSSIDSNKVIYRAKSMNPEFPGIMDLAFWKIGEEKICTNTACNDEKCPFGKICKKQM